MELAVVDLINFRQKIIVPNVFWGMGFTHEADLICVYSNNRLVEIEIKTSSSDLKNDFKKGHGHESKKISGLVYAIPVELIGECLELIPQRCGIITVHYSKYKGNYIARWAKQPVLDKGKNLPDKEIVALLRLATMRVWTLKQKLLKGK